MRIFAKIVSLAIVMLLYIQADNSLQDQNIEHHVNVIHPGVSTSEALERILVEVKNPQKKTVEFYMEVETVLCSDDQCRIDVIQIYWDTLGFYDRLAIPKNVYLEKAEGEHFNDDDNDKLNTILANKECSLKSVFKDEVVGTESSDGVDGISGATIILNTNDYVQGAVWTCYTLWHWANGDVYSIIRNITADRLSANDFISLFKNGNEAQQKFSIEQLIRRKNYDSTIVDQICSLASKADFELTKLIINYLENAPTDIYYSSIETVLKECNLEQRKRYFYSLNNYQIKAPTEFYERLFNNLEQWNTYDDINRLMNIIGDNQISSSKIINSILPLLDHSDFVIARRAYWFLSEQELSKRDSIQMNKFYNVNQGRI